QSIFLQNIRSGAIPNMLIPLDQTPCFIGRKRSKSNLERDTPSTLNIPTVGPPRRLVNGPPSALSSRLIELGVPMLVVLMICDYNSSFDVETDLTIIVD